MSIQDPHPTIDRPAQHPTAEQLPLIRVSQQYQRHIPWLINERAVEMTIRNLGLREPIGIRRQLLRPGLYDTRSYGFITLGRAKL